MKKLFSALLALALFLSLAPMALAYHDDDVAYPVEGGNIYINEATQTVTNADEDIKSAVIPNGVTNIGDSAFSGCDNLTSVIITDSVTCIGNQAFFQCDRLTSVIIPDSVTSIGAFAFCECLRLTSVVIPDKVTIIEDSTFCGCVSLTSVVIPDGVTSIEPYAFYCCGLTNVIIPDSVTSIGYEAFLNCGMTNVIIPDSIMSIGEGAFSSCDKLEKILVDSRNTSYVSKDGVLFTSDEKLLHTYPAGKTDETYSVPASITSIGNYAFHNCDSLISVAIPGSVTSIGRWAFDYCDSLKDVYYSGSEEQWAKINIEDYNHPLKSATLHYNSATPADTTTHATEYVYDTPDSGEGVAELLEGAADKVTSEASAVETVNTLTGKMTSEQKESSTGIDLATLLAETAAAKAASQSVTGKEIIINKANVAPLAEKAGSAVDAVDAALVSGGITTARYLSNTVILTSTETGEITIKIDPDILETKVDKVRVETPNYALTFKIADIEEDLTDIITIKASSVGTTVSGGGATARMGAVLMRTLAPTNNSTSVKLDVQNGKLRGPVTISLPDDDGDDSGDTTVSKDDGSAVSSKYNPATSTMDGKVTESGTYTVTTNTKDFTDISGKSQEMQTAIEYLASKGIINGTSETTFSPDGEITRAEVAALLVRSLGKLDASAKSTFDDVKTSDWFYATAASSAKCGYIKGYDDNTFKGKNQILKQETVAVVSHVLQAEMGYKLPTDTTQYLSKYSDTLANWAKPDIALATRENLIVYRVDGTFSGSKTITRGDAAIILYRMFQKIW